MKNQGDTIHLILDYTVNDTPLEQANQDEIEVYIGQTRYTLTDGDIVIEGGKYGIDLSQEDTFALKRGAAFQLRVKIGTEVGSTSIEWIPIGSTISREVL